MLTPEELEQEVQKIDTETKLVDFTYSGRRYISIESMMGLLLELQEMADEMGYDTACLNAISRKVRLCQ